MSKRSQIMRAGYNWYPDDMMYYPQPLNEDDQREFMEGWNQAKLDERSEEESERDEYEEMRTYFERWEYLKAKFEGEDT